jgi:hypothetical protein
MSYSVLLSTQNSRIPGKAKIKWITIVHLGQASGTNRCALEIGPTGLDVWRKVFSTGAETVQLIFPRHGQWVEDLNWIEVTSDGGDLTRTQAIVEVL